MAKSPRATDVSPGRDGMSQATAVETGPSHERIAQRAYERYETRGREDGRDQEDWFEAERELQQRPSGTATGGPRQRTALGD
jgi:hypothetical protein